MISISAILDVFITLNILILVAFSGWWICRYLLQTFGLQHAYRSHLKLLNALFLAVLISPALILTLNALQTHGFTAHLKFNLSDQIVSHYLSGGFDMKAADLERLLAVRGTLTENLANAVGWGASSIIAVFLLGGVISVGRLIFSAFCLYRIVRQSHAWRKLGRVKIGLSDRILVPFSTRGLRNYYIVIPSHMLGQKDEMKVSLAHELQHLRQGHIEWEILLEVLKPIFFWNPAYHAWKRQVEHLRELSCDSEVLKKGRVDIVSYCETLLSVCQRSLRKDRSFLIAFPKVTLVTADRLSWREGRKSFLEQRVVSLLHANHMRRPRILTLCFIVPLVASVLLCAVAIQRSGDWSQDRLMLSTIVNLERLDQINSQASTLGAWN